MTHTEWTDKTPAGWKWDMFCTG